MRKLGSGLVSVIICEIRPLHDKVVSRDKNGDSSTSEIATLGANKQRRTVTSPDGDIRGQHACYSAVEAIGDLRLEARVRKAPTHIKAGRLSSLKRDAPLTTKSNVYLSCFKGLVLPTR